MHGPAFAALINSLRINGGVRWLRREWERLDIVGGLGLRHGNTTPL